MYCRTCGAELSGKFCASCGTSAEDAPPTLAPTSAGMPDNLAAALCYIPLLGGLAFLLLAPYNSKKAVRFNAFQALFLLAAYVAAGFVVGIFYDVNWRLGSTLNTILRFAFIGLSLLCAVKAFNRDDFEIPLIGPIARKQA